MRRIVYLLLLFLSVTSIRCVGSGSLGSVESTSPGTITTSVSGRIATGDGAGVAGVKVEAWGSIPAGTGGCSSGGSWSGSAVTDGAGRYTISASSSSGGSGTVTVTPSLSSSDPAFNNFVISPASLSFPVSAGQSLGGVDFTAQRIFAVSGTVRDGGGAPLPGTVIALLGTDQKTAVAADNGFYVIPRVLQGPQTLTPSLPSYSFAPPFRAVTVGGGDATGNDFTGTYIPHRISGRVTVGGQALSGATVSAAGPSSVSALSGSDGAYDLGTLPRGAYTVSMSKTGYQSVSQPADLNAADLTIDFATTPLSNAVYGRVTDVARASGLVDIAITATGPATASTFTGPSGSFILGMLPTGRYTITPSTACPTYDFTPPSRQIDIAGNDATGVDFTAAFSGPGASAVGGRVLDASNVALPGIRVAASGPDNASVVTGSDGSFSLAGLHNGSYTVGPSGTGWRFSPVARTVFLCDQSVGGQDFRETTAWSRYGYLPSSAFIGPGTLQAIRPLSTGFVAGANPGFRVLRTGPYGEFVWGATLGQGSDDLAAIAEGADDTFAAAGTRYATATQPAEAIVVRMNGDGAVQWYRRLSGPGDVVGKAVALSADNGVLLAGMAGSDLLLVKFDADGTILWQKAYGGYVPVAVRADGSGATVAAGEGAAGRRLLVLRVDTAGNVVTARGYRRPDNDLAYAAAAWIFPDDSVTFTGRKTFLNFTDGSGRVRNSKDGLWAMAIRSDGAIDWQRAVTISIESDESGVAVLPGAGGTVTIAGQRRAGVDAQAFFLRLSAAGDPVWTKVYPTGYPGTRVLRAAHALADGRMIVAGDLSDYGTWGGWLAMLDAQSNGCADSVPVTITTSTTGLSRDDVPVTATDASLAAADAGPAVRPAGVPPQSQCGR